MWVTVYRTLCHKKRCIHGRFIASYFIGLGQWEEELGKVDCFAIGGLELYFNSSDHLPHHFHARLPDKWEIRVFFLTSTDGRLHYEVKWPKSGPGPSAPIIKELLSHILIHREELLVEWERKVCPR